MKKLKLVLYLFWVYYFVLWFAHWSGPQFTWKNETWYALLYFPEAKKKVYCDVPLDFVISSSKIFLLTTPCGGVFIGILLTSTKGDFIGDFTGDWHFLGDLYGLAFSSAVFIVKN